MSSRIQFHEVVTADSYPSARELLMASARVFRDCAWTPAHERDHVSMWTAEVEVEDLAAKQVYERGALKASIAIAAPREQVFAMVTSLERSAEWDPTHIGATLIEDFGDGGKLYEDLSSLTRWGPKRGGVFLGLTLPDFSPGLSLFCDQSVIAPNWRDTYEPVDQQLFIWSVEDRPNGSGCELTVMLTIPKHTWLVTENMLAMKAGWPSILTNVRSKAEAAVG